VGSENVEIVRRLYECFRVRDNETPFSLYADDIVWDGRGAQIPGLDQEYLGHDGVRNFWRQWLEAWAEIDFEMDEPLELDDGRVRVLVRQRNRGHGTGIWVDQDPYFHFWTLEDGKVTRLEFAYARPG
jgi:ketosteroid isomerase-like protein